MDNSTSSCPKLISFDQIYTSTVQPKLAAIDVFLKENTAPFHIYETAHILEIETEELLNIMEKHTISNIDSINFFTIVLNASSDICKLITSQWRYNFVNNYTPEMIADIYKLNIHKVKNAFDDLEVSCVTDMELIEIFKRIHVTLFC